MKRGIMGTSMWFERSREVWTRNPCSRRSLSEEEGVAVKKRAMRGESSGGGGDGGGCIFPTPTEMSCFSSGEAYSTSLWRNLMQTECILWCDAA